ncbi:hillarin-like [Gigantopelta aegis]|uniref:hillarin-like n=1 Tax=Gigantopelta aegis TaxID=1735272 RepID=UPI001B88D08A|nr:hillarin-like [Gigantopelta aegis]
MRSTHPTEEDCDLKIIETFVLTMYHKSYTMNVCSKTFCQLKLLSYMPSAQPIRLVASGVDSESKYVDVKQFLPSYPKPEPPNTKRKEIFREDNDTQAVAYDAMKVLADSHTTFILLIKRLTGHLRREAMKAWALFCWVGAQCLFVAEAYWDLAPQKISLLVDFQNPKTPGQILKLSKPSSPFCIAKGDSFIKTLSSEEPMTRNLGQDIKEITFDFLTCNVVDSSSDDEEEAEIPCVIICGIAKGSDYSVGDQELKGESFWNAAYVEGGWHLLHPHWACQSIAGYQAKQWIRFEEDGQHVDQQAQPSLGKLISYQDAFYFLTDPDNFKYFCRPHEDQTAWQLLPVPVSLETFMNFPLVTSIFLTSSARFTFRRGQINTIKADCGESEVVIIAENSKWEGQLAYTLYYRADSENQFSSETSPEQYVILCNKNHKNEIKFLIRFPTAGIYRLTVIDKMKAKWLCDFKLVCDEPLHHCNPLPLNPDIGWGPGEASKRNGISNLSHTDGIIKAKKDEKLEISFDTKENTKIQARLKHVKKSDEELDKFISKKQNQSAVSIKLNLPDNDEYALTIDTRLPMGMFQNALNYLIRSTNKNHQQRPYGNPTEKRITDDLESAIKEESRGKLVTAIEKYEKFGLKDPGVLSRANDRLDVLRIKDNLGHAILAGRIDKLDKAIKNANGSKHVNELREMIDKAKKTLTEVQYLVASVPELRSSTWWLNTRTEVQYLVASVPGLRSSTSWLQCQD